jgi:hypothetical protein
MLAKHPASSEPHHAKVDQAAHAALVERYGATPPGNR